MLHAGMNTMDFGQVKPLQFLLLTLDGFIYQQILYHSITLCQDFKVNFQDILPLGLMDLKVLITIGFIKVQILTALGFFPKESGDG